MARDIQPGIWSVVLSAIWVPQNPMLFIISFPIERPLGGCTLFINLNSHGFGQSGSGEINPHINCAEKNANIGRRTCPSLGKCYYYIVYLPSANQKWPSGKSPISLDNFPAINLHLRNIAISQRLACLILGSIPYHPISLQYFIQYSMMSILIYAFPMDFPSNSKAHHSRYFSRFQQDHRYVHICMHVYIYIDYRDRIYIYIHWL